MNSRCGVCGGTRWQPFARKGQYIYQRCNACGLLALDPIPSLQVIEAHYRSKFECGNYQTLLAFTDQYRRIYKDYVSWMQRHVELGSTRTLDVGCFTGELIAALLGAGADAYGTELQTAAVSIASSRLPGRVYAVDITEPGGPFVEKSLDVVTMMAVIEHVREPVALLKRIHSLLKDDGWLFLETPNASSWTCTLTQRFWPPFAPVEHLYLFSRPAIARALADAGFELIEVRPHIKWLPVAYVDEMLKHYGPQLRTPLRPLRLLSAVLRGAPLPFFVGEMLVAARARGMMNGVSGHTLRRSALVRSPDHDTKTTRATAQRVIVGGNV